MESNSKTEMSPWRVWDHRQGKQTSMDCCQGHKGNIRNALLCVWLGHSPHGHEIETCEFECWTEMDPAETLVISEGRSQMLVNLKRRRGRAVNLVEASQVCFPSCFHLPCVEVSGMSNEKIGCSKVAGLESKRLKCFMCETLIPLRRLQCCENVLHAPKNFIWLQNFQYHWCTGFSENTCFSRLTFESVNSSSSFLLFFWINNNIPSGTFRNIQMVDVHHQRSRPTFVLGCVSVKEVLRNAQTTCASSLHKQAP